MNEMLKKLFILFLVILASCEGREPIFYDDVARVYFDKEQTNYSFGDQPLSVQEITIYIKVNIMGQAASTVRKFKIEIDKEKTTAIEGVQIEVLPSEFEVLPDSIYGYIPIKLLRSGIDGLIEESEVLALNLVNGGDFVTGAKEALSTKLFFNNFLEEPSWWAWIEYYVGDYDPQKYQKYIEIHGSPIDEEYIGSNFLSVISEFYQVKEFFDNNPEFGVEFPQDAQWP